MTQIMNRASALGALLSAFGVSSLLCTGVVLADDDPKTLIAEQVRAQQHKCGTVQKAVRDEAASKPDAAVWILTCDNATYQVQLHPSMAAEIKKLN